MLARKQDFDLEVGLEALHRFDQAQRVLADAVDVRQGVGEEQNLHERGASQVSIQARIRKARASQVC